jgi:D-alanyl-D-alanine carboxypeptidase/D-alanyl-D-alanine-endopeptidase (penicillin-binding protein 4)
VALLGTLLLGSTGLAASAPDRVEALRADLERVLRAPRWTSATWGVLAVSLDTGDTLFARTPAVPLAPASNLKLATTAAALERLGPDYRYQTLVLGDGPISDGILRGDLILYGTGDPGLSDRFFESRTAALEGLANQLLEAGVRVVTGDVVGDGSFFEGPLTGDGWDPRDLNDWFAAPSSALSFNENMVTLRIEPAVTQGARPTIRTLPADADVPLANLATTGRGRIRIQREEPSRPILVEGAIPLGGREVWRQMTVPDPSRYAAAVFLNVLREKGIGVRGEVRTVRHPADSRVTGRPLWAPGLRPGAPRILARHRSPPLREYLTVVNKRSHNLLADMILKTLGRVEGGDGSFAGGARVVKAFLADRIGADTTAVEIHDGSGLSALDRMAAGDFVRLLAYMSVTDRWDEYWATLPEAGNPRELRRMYRSPAAGNLRAKTGTIEDVSALSGVVHSASGERIAFSILVNDVPSTRGAKRIEDRIGTRLASFERTFEPRAGAVLAGLIGSPEAVEAEGADQGLLARAPEADVPTGGRDTAPAAADGVEAASSTRMHRVRRGENLTVIARRYGVTLNDLIAANGGISPRSLQAGAELRIPPAEPGAAPSERTDPQRHRVRPGENFTVIAREYGVALNDLLDANPDVSPRTLQAGRWIRIPPPTNHDPGR